MDKTNDFKRNDWIEYVRILRTIELNKMNNSFKLSAVLIFVVTLTNKLINNYSTIRANKESVFVFILLFTVLINIITVIFRIANLTSRKKTVNAITRKKLSELDRQSLYMGYITELLYDFVAILANFYIVNKMNINYGLTKWPYFVFFIFNILGLLVKIVIFSMNFLLINRKTSRKARQIEINKFMKDARLDAKKIEKNKLFLFFCKIVKIIFFIILIYPVSLSLIEIFKKNIIIQEYSMFINAICLVAILGSIQVISIYIAYKIRYSWLEQFEKKIFIENLNSKSIKQILEVEYFNNVNYEIFYFSENNNFKKYSKIIK